MTEAEAIVRARRESADQERSAIIGIVERHMRLVTHGHGADGAQVLQHLLTELEERDRSARSAEGDGR
jgi:hypothetical protein